MHNWDMQKVRIEPCEVFAVCCLVVLFFSLLDCCQKMETLPIRTWIWLATTVLSGSEQERITSRHIKTVSGRYKTLTHASLLK